MMIFGDVGEEEVYISSSDWMTRNLDNRVEVTCPIYDEHIKKELIDTFSICWNDTVKARVFSKNQDNQYRNPTNNPIRSQVKTYEYYVNKISVVK
jgi:polyphosphate kinase